MSFWLSAFSGLLGFRLGSFVPGCLPAEYHRLVAREDHASIRRYFIAPRIGCVAPRRLYTIYCRSRSHRAGGRHTWDRNDVAWFARYQGFIRWLRFHDETGHHGLGNDLRRNRTGACIRTRCGALPDLARLRDTTGKPARHTLIYYYPKFCAWVGRR